MYICSPYLCLDQLKTKHNALKFCCLEAFTLTVIGLFLYHAAVPKIIFSAGPMVIINNTTAQFVCTAYGYPTPRLNISRGGRCFTTGIGRTTNNRNVTMTLTIPQVQPRDAGQYICTASNEMGTVNKTTLLVVYGKKIIKLMIAIQQQQQQ